MLKKLSFTKTYLGWLTFLVLTGGLGFSTGFAAITPDWSEGALIPLEGRTNPYGLDPSSLEKSVRAGKIHAQIYPIPTTGLLPPIRPIKNFFDEDNLNPLRRLITQLFKNFSHLESFNDFEAWLGLHPYPSESDTGVYSVPYPQGVRPTFHMGYTEIEKDGATGFTFSCAACHSSSLFGKTVLGMTNRFPRANHIFAKVQSVTPFMNPFLFRVYNKATKEETQLLRIFKTNMKSIGTKNPQVIGLDTSLAQVALSLAHRNPDSMATKSKAFEKNPRPDLLDHARADSKPAVWWNLKYKNRWLLDGSIVSGNPIFTNILWNEIGRGMDLSTLSDWIAANTDVLRDITNAVLNIDAPRVTDFFPAELIDLEQAKRGEKIFENRCSHCHGHYEKAWSHSAQQQSLMTYQDLLKTTKVSYHQSTPVINIGTDPLRAQGMKSLEKLNELDISKRHQTVVRMQNGYVPPPLVGIWARWPYLHNNSVPNLCALLTKASERPKQFYMGEANNKDSDYDFECGGYPLGNKTPAAWRQKAFSFDTKTIGMSNQGHDEGIFLKDGKELLTVQNKQDLIRFLQTL